MSYLQVLAIDVAGLYLPIAAIICWVAWPTSKKEISK